MKAALVVAMVCWCSVANAQPSWLIYKAPSQCPTAAALGVRIAAHGAPIDVSSPVSVTVVSRNGAWLATIVWRGASRAITAPTCAHAVDAAALVVAMSLADSPVASVTSAPSRRTIPIANPPRTSPRVNKIAEHPQSGSGISAEVGVGGASQLGALPGLTLGTRGVFALLLRRWRLQVTGTIWQSADVRQEDQTLAGIGLWDVGVATCYSLHQRVAACAGGNVGRLSGSGMDVVAARADTAWWLAATASANYEQPVYKSVAIGMNLEVQLPIAAPRFTLASGKVLHDPAPLAARMTIGMLVHFK